MTSKYAVVVFRVGLGALRTWAYLVGSVVFAGEVSVLRGVGLRVVLAVAAAVLFAVHRHDRRDDIGKSAQACNTQKLFLLTDSRDRCDASIMQRCKNNFLAKQVIWTRAVNVT